MRSLRLIALGPCLAGFLAAPSTHAQTVLHDLLVSSRNTNAVVRFDGATGAFVDVFVRPGAGGLSATQEVLLDSNGDLLVTGRGTSSVLRFSRRTGEPRGSFTSGYVLDAPTKMKWGPDGDLYVSQWGDRINQTTVAVFDGQTGAFLREATPNLDRPMDLYWDDTGTLHVVSFGSRDVRRFAADGTLIDIFVPADPNLQGPVNLWLDDSSDLLIADWSSGAIRRYDAQTGSFVGTFASGLQNVEGHAIGPDGALYIGEWGADRVRRFDATSGQSLGIFAAAGSNLGAPNSVLFVERLPDFTLSTSATSATVASGGQGQVPVQITPQRGLPFDDPVTLTCSSLSSRLQCSVQPGTVTPGFSAADATVQLTAAAATAARNARSGWGFLVFSSLALGLVVSRRRLSAPIAVLMIALAMVVSCGGSSGSTTGPAPNPAPPAPDPMPMPEIVQIQVTATSGEIERSANVTVTIQ
jgi:streptogramin lyase